VDDEQGFTLLQLMVALVIVGVLASVAVPGMAKRVNASKRVEAQVSLGTIARMQDAFFTSRGYYASTFRELGFRTDAGGSHGRRYQFSLTALDSGRGYVATATANLDGDDFDDVLFVARAAEYKGVTVIAKDDITNQAFPVEFCFRASSNDRNGDGNGNAGGSGDSNDRNGDGNGNAGQGDGGRRTCVRI